MRVCVAKLWVAGLAVAGAQAHAQAFTLSSPHIAANARLTEAQVYNGFGCKGQNISPALVWRGAPKGTKSFALTLYDPDAPTGSGWWHWVVINLPADTYALPEGAGAPGGHALPRGAMQGRTDFGTAGFGGACPPAGDLPHRYVFTVYALNIDKIDVPPEASAALIGFMINAHKLRAASFTAKYARK